jgi:hypothetical protein
MLVDVAHEIFVLRADRACGHEGLKMGWMRALYLASLI